MKLKIACLTVLIPSLLILSGCGTQVESDQNPSMSSSAREIRMLLIKSETNLEQVVVQEASQITMKKLLELGEVEYEAKEDQVAKLDGVFSTLSKSWNLYINNEKQEHPLNAIVNSNDQVEWRYE